MKRSDERLGIVGAGTIACGLAASAAGRCAQVTVWARSEQSAGRARAVVASALERLENGAAPDQIEVVTDLSELAGATLAVEAVREDDAVKREVLASLAATLDGDAILASTTSSLRIEALAQASGRPSRFFGLHVFNPVERMPLVELCFPPQAGAEVRRRAAAFSAAIGKISVEVPDETGFVVNRLLFPFLFDAVRLLERTGLEAKQIDACMKLGASHPMGPLELLDLIGLDVADSIGEALYADGRDPAHRPPGTIKSLVREGKLGRKSGRGFHAYGD